MISLATPNPARMPRIVAVNEMISASSTISRRTCFVLAPMPRINASSRRRWPIVMPNTLLMMNAATKAVMKAKISRPVPKIEMIWLIESDASSLTSWPVTTSVRGGSTCWTAAWTVVEVGALLDADVDHVPLIGQRRGSAARTRGRTTRSSRRRTRRCRRARSGRRCGTSRGLPGARSRSRRRPRSRCCRR